MIILAELQHLFGEFFRIDFGTIVLKVKFNLLDWFCEHELVLWYPDFLPIFVLVELFIYFDDFLEIQFLKIDVHSPNEEVYQITLL